MEHQPNAKIAMTNQLPDDFLDDDVMLLGGDDPAEEGNYDDFLDSLDIEREPEKAEEKKEVTSEKSPEVEEKKDQDTPPPAADTNESWEAAPEPINNWKELADQHKIQATSEEEFRNEVTLRQFAQQQFQSSAQAQSLYQLASEDTPAKVRISRYVAEKIKEPYEQPNDPDLLARVEGKLTDFFDDEGELTPKGQKLDTHLKDQYAGQLDKLVSDWKLQGEQQIQNSKLFTQALQTQLSQVAGLSKQQQQQVYQYVRQGGLERIVDGVDEQGKALAPAEAARLQAEAAIWNNPISRKILLEQIANEHKAKGESETLKKYLS